MPSNRDIATACIRALESGAQRHYDCYEAFYGVFPRSDSDEGPLSSQGS